MVISRLQRKRTVFLIYRYLLINFNDDKLFLDWVYVTLNNEEIKFYLPILKSLLTKKDKIIEMINNNMQNWVFVRLGKVEQSILLFACYETIYLKTDFLISINEAVKLAKKYCESKSYGLINSILDKVLNSVIIN
ncbi:transcription antitermination protein NusB [Mycoplasma sp. SG1]|uniref:transcription antitermination protein NusB n=1 Tax=Mycoplasma sp. SG1 TaxID=2810348 RepID=UPI002023CA4F|nr:transcription antitermination protein NusB [Mycoplasma sp. SG1]URM53121.1 transcription antitermination protein NusB [Mycoplasma sp. SG1]